MVLRKVALVGRLWLDVKTSHSIGAPCKRYHLKAGEKSVVEISGLRPDLYIAYGPADILLIMSNGILCYVCILIIVPLVLQTVYTYTIKTGAQTLN